MQRFIEITGDEREYFFGMAWKYCEPVIGKVSVDTSVVN